MTKIKLYVKQNNSNDYYRQKYDLPDFTLLPENYYIKPNDIWTGQYGSYHVDKVQYSIGTLKIYATLNEHEKVLNTNRKKLCCYIDIHC